MVESCCGPGFLRETAQPFRIAGNHAGQNFNRYITAQPRIVPAINLSHPPSADQCLDFIVGKFGPGRECGTNSGRKKVRASLVARREQGLYFFAQ